MRTDTECSAFTREVLENTGVIVVPGWGFGETLKQAVRLSFGLLVDGLDKIDEAMQRIGTFLSDSVIEFDMEANDHMGFCAVAECEGPH